MNQSDANLFCLISTWVEALNNIEGYAEFTVKYKNCPLCAPPRYSKGALVRKRNAPFPHKVSDSRLQIVILIRYEYPSIQADSEIESIADMSSKFIEVSWYRKSWYGTRRPLNLHIMLTRRICIISIKRWGFAFTSNIHCFPCFEAIYEAEIQRNEFLIINKLASTAMWILLLLIRRNNKCITRI